MAGVSLEELVAFHWLRGGSGFSVAIAIAIAGPACHRAQVSTKAARHTQTRDIGGAVIEDKE
jgi:hypothetical protein